MLKSLSDFAQNDDINFFNIMSVYVCQISSGICLYSGNSVLTYSISKTSLYSEGLLSFSPSFLVPTRAILILYKSRTPFHLDKEQNSITYLSLLWKGIFFQYNKLLRFCL